MDCCAKKMMTPTAGAPFAWQQGVVSYIANDVDDLTDVAIFLIPARAIRIEIDRNRPTLIHDEAVGGARSRVCSYKAA